MSDIVLSTYPFWTRTSNHTSFGGNRAKRNHLTVGVINAETDVGAEDICRLASDLAAIGLTAAFCRLKFTCRDSGSLHPNVTECVIGTQAPLVTPYSGNSPPTGFPTVARASNGVVLVTLAATYTDEYDKVGTFKMRFVDPSSHGTTFANIVTNIETDSTVRVYAFNAAGTALSDAVIELEIS